MNARAGEETSSSLVELTLDGHVAVLRLANPERRNVLAIAMATALRESAEAIGRDADVRCVVLTGSDTTFAAVNGHAIGGGLELELACTLRVAAAEAKLGMPEARLGIIPATGGLARLPRLLGVSTAARLLLTGDLLDGTEAERLGIVNAAVPAETVLEEALALASRIAAAAPLATRAIVDSLRHDQQLSIAEANVRTEDRLAILLTSADRREGASALLERRDPEFNGG
jgi:enoyl-CoA hydratase/carnithine racemase